VIVNCASLLFFKEVVARHYNKGMLDGDEHWRHKKKNWHHQCILGKTIFIARKSCNVPVADFYTDGILPILPRFPPFAICF